MSNRTFNWISSVDGDAKALGILESKLNDFYSRPEIRADYQRMVDAVIEMPQKGEFGHLVLDFVLSLNPQDILEVGCGNGRFYRQLKKLNYTGQYKGIEVASYVIENNQRRHPEVDWRTAGAYQIPFENESFEMVFAYFVLEHLVYPEKALIEMLRVIKKQGKLVLVFPDFVASRGLASQELGFSPIGSASIKLKRGMIIDALVSIYDSKIRLKSALKNLERRFGQFAVNTNPICFNHKDLMGADVDAVYIASKEEVSTWSNARGYKVSFPCGIEAEFSNKAFMVISKSDT